MISLSTSPRQKTVSFCDENDTEIRRMRRKKRSTRSKKKKSRRKPAVVSSDEDDSNRTQDKRMARTVSFDETSNERVEVPRISRKYKDRCWITKEEIRHNILMNKVRGLVRVKLLNLLEEKDDFGVDADETETDFTESESEYDDDLLEGLSDAGKIHYQQEQERLAQEQRTIRLARKDRILQHLLDNIMERRKEDIHSFLTSKCSISFNTKKKH